MRTLPALALAIVAFATTARAEDFFDPRTDWSEANEGPAEPGTTVVTLGNAYSFATDSRGDDVSGIELSLGYLSASRSRCGGECLVPELGDPESFWGVEGSWMPAHDALFARLLAGIGSEWLRFAFLLGAGRGHDGHAQSAMGSELSLTLRVGSGAFASVFAPFVRSENYGALGSGANRSVLTVGLRIDLGVRDGDPVARPRRIAEDEWSSLNVR